jgi:hypothetical protein
MERKKKCANLVKTLSLGKYQTKLYYGNKQEEYSTIMGGILTILAALVLIIASITILLQTI